MEGKVRQQLEKDLNSVAKLKRGESKDGKPRHLTFICFKLCRGIEASKAEPSMWHVSD